MQQINKKLTVNGIDVQVLRKNIKNLHLGVYPPDGQVRVSVPQHITDDNVRLAIVSKINWIKKRKKEFKGQARQTPRRYVSGECQYFFGKRCRLHLIERKGKHEIILMKSNRLKMCVNPKTSIANKEKLLNEWYRAELKKCLPELIDKWQPIIGKKVSDWGVRRMKTRWGTCNTTKKRIWLNLELAKKPPECLEYVVVHEMVHLLEPSHNKRFAILMDKYIPKWRSFRDILNNAPLAHEDWSY